MNYSITIIENAMASLDNHFVIVIVVNTSFEMLALCCVKVDLGKSYFVLNST